MELKFFNPKQWDTAAQRIHAAVFGETIPYNFQRIDFAIVGEGPTGEFLAYTTGVEINSELLRIMFSGTSPKHRGTGCGAEFAALFLAWLRKGPWLSAVTIIKNDNIASLRTALSQGFRVIGVQCYEGDTLLELQLKLKPGPATLAPPQGG